MSKKRIYELAKELNVSSKEVIAAAKKKGIEVGNHMSTIGENEERQVRAAFAPKKAPVEKKAAAFKAENRPKSIKGKVKRSERSLLTSDQPKKAGCSPRSGKDQPRSKVSE